MVSSGPTTHRAIATLAVMGLALLFVAVVVLNGPHATENVLPPTGDGGDPPPSVNDPTTGDDAPTGGDEGSGDEGADDATNDPATEPNQPPADDDEDEVRDRAPRGPPANRGPGDRPGYPGYGGAGDRAWDCTLPGEGRPWCRGASTPPGPLEPTGRPPSWAQP